MHDSSTLSVSVLVCLLCLVGCIGGNQPSAIEVPDVDPESAAASAIELYDADGDAALAGAELDKVPAIRDSLKAYDANGDSRVSEDEIAKHLSGIFGYGVSMMQASAVVRLDGRPLPGAKVRMEPEPFLGEGVKPAEGTTGQTGSSRVVIPDELLPEDQRGLNAMHVGLYKVRITHPDREIPAKYNSETTLGFELSAANYAAADPTFNLSSR